jgi:hypothetical protein
MNGLKSISLLRFTMICMEKDLFNYYNLTTFLQKDGADVIIISIILYI